MLCECMCVYSYATFLLSIRNTQTRDKANAGKHVWSSREEGTKSKKRKRMPIISLMSFMWK